VARQCVIWALFPPDIVGITDFLIAESMRQIEATWENRLPSDDAHLSHRQDNLG
jgi:hypothetical protein